MSERSAKDRRAVGLPLVVRERYPGDAANELELLVQRAREAALQRPIELEEVERELEGVHVLEQAGLLRQAVELGLAWRRSAGPATPVPVGDRAADPEQWRALFDLKCLRRGGTC